MNVVTAMVVGGVLIFGSLLVGGIWKYFSPPVSDEYISEDHLANINRIERITNPARDY